MINKLEILKVSNYLNTPRSEGAETYPPIYTAMTRKPGDKKISSEITLKNLRPDQSQTRLVLYQNTDLKGKPTRKHKPQVVWELQRFGDGEFAPMSMSEIAATQERLDLRQMVTKTLVEIFASNDVQMRYRLKDRNVIFHAFNTNSQLRFSILDGQNLRGNVYLEPYVQPSR